MIPPPSEGRGNPILRRLPAGATMVEVGVFRGALSILILKRRPDVKLIMVDNWARAEEQPESYRVTGDIHAHHTAQEVADNWRCTKRRVKPYIDRARIMAIPSLVAAKKIANRSVNLVFLDADHSYEGVSADLDAWVPKVVRGGYIGGHDFRNPNPKYDFSGVERAVRERLRTRCLELDDNYTWFCRL